MDIAAQVKEIISEQLDIENPEEIKDSQSFIDDLDADSLAIVELLLALEEKFEVSIPEDETEQIKTVGDAISYIQELKSK